MRYLLLSLLLLLAGLPKALAQAEDSSDEGQALRRANELVLERRYESAWKVLHAADPRNRRPAVVLRKADLALNYHTATEGLRHFAFQDLKLLDPSLDSLRQLPQRVLPYAFPVRRVLDSLRQEQPTNYKLDRALGDYYFTAQQCECAETNLDEDELFRRLIQHYQPAHEHGQGDYLSYFALGYAHQRLGQFQESLVPFRRSLELRPTYATTHLNLAFVLLELKDLEAARTHANRAMELFSDRPHREDAAFLLSQIEARLK
ncbi:hypothetical protein [Hymenobacter weizhouensis]|uniref:hypothetical protein n=1 Tax=Hymenobacter sp. YIM 151500-1 TaxID=2987689 RepID=UPI002226B4C4|nr:hypothetical protein [Hymenobacter sp. YIM 151500-1]UYZ62363.1 hypothetical protein OIS53_15350 [Hymenobacter sp. YIM 151500-1]